MVNHFLCIVSSVFIKRIVPGIFFLYFHLFTTFESKLMFNMYFEDDRIQTTDFWCQKQPSLPTEPQPQPHSSICLLRIAYCLHKIKYHGAEIVKRSLTERFLPTTKDPIRFKLTEFFEHLHAKVPQRSLKIHEERVTANQSGNYYLWKWIESDRRYYVLCSVQPLFSFFDGKIFSLVDG